LDWRDTGTLGDIAISDTINDIINDMINGAIKERLSKDNPAASIRKATIRKIRIVQKEGSQEVSKNLHLNNLDTPTVKSW